MVEVQVEKVMNRQKVGEAVHSFLDSGLEMLAKDKFNTTDHAKMRLLRVMGTHISSAVAMIQQETAMVRAALVAERMKQLGFNGEEQKKLT